MNTYVTMQTLEGTGVLKNTLFTIPNHSEIIDASNCLLSILALDTTWNVKRLSLKILFKILETKAGFEKNPPVLEHWKVVLEQNRTEVYFEIKHT